MQKTFPCALGKVKFVLQITLNSWEYILTTNLNLMHTSTNYVKPQIRKLNVSIELGDLLM